MEFAIEGEHIFAALVGVGAGGGSALFIKLRRMGRAAMVAALADHAEVLEQVTPNGGQTDHLGDRVVRIEERLRSDAERMDRIEQKLDMAVAETAAVKKDTAIVAAWVTAGEKR